MMVQILNTKLNTGKIENHQKLFEKNNVTFMGVRRHLKTGTLFLAGTSFQFFKVENPNFTRKFPNDLF